MAGLILVASANAQIVAAEEPNIGPEIVVQVGHQAKVEAAVWANDGKNLITLAQDGSIVVWDTLSTNIVNTARLPVNWNDLGLSECVKLYDLTLDEETETITFTFALDLEETHISAQAGEQLGGGLLLSTLQSQYCKGIGEAASWYSYRFDLGTMQLKSGGPAEIPEGIEKRSFSVLASRDENSNEVRHSFTYPVPPEKPFVKLPFSPDGKLHLEHNYDDGKRGDFNRRDDKLQFNQSTCASLTRCRYGVNILSEGGEVIASLTGNPKSYFLDADLTGDGRKLVRVEGLRNETRTRVEVLDLADGQSWDSFDPKRAYHQVRWLGKDRFTLFSEGYRATDDTDDAMEGFPPALVVEKDCAQSGECLSVASYTGMEPTDDKGRFVGLFSLQDCYRGSRRSPNAAAFCPHGTELPPSEAVDAQVIVPVFTNRLSAASASPTASENQWQTLAYPTFPEGKEVTAVRLSLDRTKMAVAVRDNPALENGIEGYLDNGSVTQRDSVWLYDLSSSGHASAGKEVISFSEILEQGYLGMRDISISESEDRLTIFVSGLNAAGGIFDLHFSPDGQKIIFAKAPYQNPQDIRLYSVDPNDETGVQYLIQRIYLRHHVSDVIETKQEVVRGELGNTPIFGSRQILPVGSDRAFGLENRELIELESGRIIATGMHAGRILRAGHIENSETLWGASEDGVLRFWDARDGNRLLTLYLFPGNRFFAVTPEGRYDTNLGPDSNLIRWVVPDAPWQSLAAQTFMRDNYEPGLYRKLLDCRVARNCDNAFAPLRSIASLNRVLPSVEITEVTPGSDPSEALVRVKVTEGVDPDAANGKTRSGILSPRLFIDNKLVAYAPEKSRSPRRRARSSRPDEQVYNFRVPVATRQGSERMLFSAYAFNEDRIKSETASFTYERPPATPRKRRAFVINIGIDHYESAKFASLSFAGNDARLLADRLGAIAEFETRQVTIGGSLGANGLPRAINREIVLDALGLLVSDEGRNKALRKLSKEGIDASGLAVATPDDIVIISYAGHGWADERGDFYLIPSDVRWDFDQDALQRDTAISAEDLTAILELVQAGEISLIIDACHSAASVDGGEFKPGPMGDASLGQLAYDKGIRILAATQADDLALEDSRLQQGLLTYALAKEGLTDDGGASDQNRDGNILLDEWLAYAAQRLPQLSEDIGRGNFRSITFLNNNQASRTVRVQRPSLFDFNSTPSQIILRSGLDTNDPAN